MLGDTIELNFGTSEDPDVRTLNRVNNDNFSTEYRLRETDREYSVLVRHSKEKNKLRGRVMDRHNVTLSVKHFPTEVYPQGREIQAYSVFRNASDDMDEDIIPLVTAVSVFTQENADKLIGWRS